MRDSAETGEGRQAAGTGPALARRLHDRNQTPAISPDGRFVTFTSMAAGPGPGEVVGTSDVVVLDRQLGTAELVSASLSGAPGNADSFGPSISSGGRYIAFTSNASDLVAGGVTAPFNVFVRDRERGVTELVSVNDGGIPGDGMSFRASISADGRYVSFASAAANLAAGCPGDIWQIFVRDREREVTELISSGSDGAAGDRPSAGSALSADGRYVIFHSGASNLLPGRHKEGGIFLRDRAAGTTELVSIGHDGAPAPGCAGWAISADGRFVAFASQAPNLVPGVPGGAWQIFARDRERGVTELASAGRAGEPAGGPVHFLPLLSADGRFVAFASQAPNLVPGVPGGTWQIFARDRERGVTELASAGRAGEPANGDCAADSVGAGISETGRFVCFTSAASNLAAEKSGGMAVFVRDRENRVTERAVPGQGQLLPPPPRPPRVAVSDRAIGWQVLQAGDHGQVLAAPPGMADKSRAFAGSPASPASKPAGEPGRQLRHDRHLEPRAAETVALVDGRSGEIQAGGEAHLEVPYFSRSRARFSASRSYTAWLGDSPVNADKIIHTDHWQVDARPPAKVTSAAPAGSVSDGAGGLVWQTEVQDNWLSVHEWDELEFQTPGRLFRSHYTVSGSFQFGSAFFVVSGDAGAAT